ncbi:hypothetical protein K439DRAFT_1648151 [Ramaria rubella]|nr:hypothetical protein K439DRAFT_1648151 [Ramaria rubella]
MVVSSRLSTLRFKLSLLPTYHRNGDTVAAASDKSFRDGCHGFTEDKRRRLYGPKAGQAMVPWRCPTFVMNAFNCPCTYCRLHANGKQPSKEEPEVSRVARDSLGRCVRGAKPGVPPSRYHPNLELFFEAVKKEAMSTHCPLPVASTRSNMHSTLAFRTCIIEDPIVQSLSVLMISLPCRAVEQSRGDSCNIVVIVMGAHNLNLQSAIDGKIFHREVHSIDKDIEGYILGLQDWIAGSLWSFLSEKYFGVKHKVGVSQQQHSRRRPLL